MKRQLRFYCFSPPVMVATFVVEIFSAAYVLYRYKLSAIGRTIVAMLVSLAAFQIAEYFVCTNSSIAIAASRFGFFAITLLPPLGLYLMSLLTTPLRRWQLWSLFVVAFLVAVYFLVSPIAFESYECTGNYVIFQIGYRAARLYGIYYFGIIGWTIMLGGSYLRAHQKSKTRKAIKWLLAGYALFITPVAILTVLHPDTTQALPSVLCGFAVTIALILVARIAPLTLVKRRS